MAALAVKAPEAFRTISEVATELDVPQHVLRFWESRFSQIRPVKRAGGRRYYRPDDVDLLCGIRALLYTDGYTIKGVQKILREQGVRAVVEIGRKGPEVRARHAPPAAAENPDGPRFARAAIARVQEAHADILPGIEAKPNLSREARAKLEQLYEELAQMRQRLHVARERIRA